MRNPSSHPSFWCGAGASSRRPSTGDSQFLTNLGATTLPTLNTIKTQTAFADGSWPRAKVFNLLVPLAHPCVASVAGQRVTNCGVAAHGLDGANRGCRTLLGLGLSFWTFLCLGDSPRRRTTSDLRAARPFSRYRQPLLASPMAPRLAPRRGGQSHSSVSPHSFSVQASWLLPLYENKGNHP